MLEQRPAKLRTSKRNSRGSVSAATTLRKVNELQRDPSQRSVLYGVGGKQGGDKLLSESVTDAGADLLPMIKKLATERFKDPKQVDSMAKAYGLDPTLVRTIMAMPEAELEGLVQQFHSSARAFELTPDVLLKWSNLQRTFQEAGGEIETAFINKLPTLRDDVGTVAKHLEIIIDSTIKKGSEIDRFIKGPLKAGIEGFTNAIESGAFRTTTDEFLRNTTSAIKLLELIPWSTIGRVGTEWAVGGLPGVVAGEAAHAAVGLLNQAAPSAGPGGANKEYEKAGGDPNSYHPNETSHQRQEREKREAAAPKTGTGTPAAPKTGTGEPKAKEPAPGVEKPANVPAPEKPQAPATPQAPFNTPAGPQGPASQRPAPQGGGVGINPDAKIEPQAKAPAPGVAKPSNVPDIHAHPLTTDRERGIDGTFGHKPGTGSGMPHTLKTYDPGANSDNLPSHPLTGRNTKGVNPALVDAITKAQSTLPPGWHVEVTSAKDGRNDPRSAHSHGLAMDVRLFDENGKPLSNRGEQPRNVEAYKRFAAGVYQNLSPEEKAHMRWGGQFGTQLGGGGDTDLMHIDLGLGRTTTHPGARREPIQKWGDQYHFDAPKGHIPMPPAHDEATPKPQSSISSHDDKPSWYHPQLQGGGKKVHVDDQTDGGVQIRSDTQHSGAIVNPTGSLKMAGGSNWTNVKGNFNRDFGGQAPGKGIRDFGGFAHDSAEIESRGGTMRDRPGSKFHGKYQMGPGFGGHGDEETRFRRGSETNADQLRKSLGREPTHTELYMAHQQGANAAAKMGAHPDRTPHNLGVSDKNIRANHGDPNKPSKDFVNKFAPRMHEDGVGGPGPSPLPLNT